MSGSGLDTIYLGAATTAQKPSPRPVPVDYFDLPDAIRTHYSARESRATRIDAATIEVRREDRAARTVAVDVWTQGADGQWVCEWGKAEDTGDRGE